MPGYQSKQTTADCIGAEITITDNGTGIDENYQKSF